MFTGILSNLQLSLGSPPLVRFYRRATVFSAESETGRVKCLVSRVISMGRCNTKLDPAWH